MLPDADKAGFAPIEIPVVRRGPWSYVKIFAALAVVVGLIVAWMSGYRPPILLAGTKSPIEFVEIDRGDVDVYVVETGSIESANNTTIRNQVEAILGTVGGTQGTTAGKSSTSGSASGQAGGASGSGGGQGGSGGGGAQATTSKSKTSKAKAGSSSTSKTSTSGGSTSSGSSGSSSSSGSSGSSGSSSSGSASSSSSASSSGTATSSKPVLRSFTTTVTPHTPLRPATAKAAETTKKAEPQQQKGGGGGGRGGGRGGRGGGGGMQEEAAGSTRIVSILPEGSRVTTDQVVAVLDKSSLEDEEKNQYARYLSAKAYVDQAKSMLEVAEISLREYRDGIFPQDLQLIQYYIESCTIEKDRARRNLGWSTDMLALGYRTPFQVASDRAALEQTTIALKEAQGMLERLTKFTGPKLIKSLEAKVQAILSDKLTQEAAFKLEESRLARIRRNIERCTVKAPGDGIVVYANVPSQRGSQPIVIDQGVTLRENQAIFNLPDPKHMRVKAKINESKVSLVHMGQPAIITVDAFPDRPLKGVVQEVTPISVPIRESDVRVYYANVNITEGFDSLRPGLSAEIMVDIQARHDVTRVPVESIRWVGGKGYVALNDRSRSDSDPNAWRWQPIEIGLSDPDYAEVLNGLKAGDRIVARPGNLPPPVPETVKKSPNQVANRS